MERGVVIIKKPVIDNKKNIIMTAEELFEAGCDHRSRALENTQYTHVHSVDIDEGVFKNYFLPSAKEGYPPAIIEVAKHYIKQGEKSKAYSWVKEYKKQTNCSRRQLLMLFGPSVLTSLSHI